jgi:hypothetical protein
MRRPLAAVPAAAGLQARVEPSATARSAPGCQSRALLSLTATRAYGVSRPLPRSAANRRQAAFAPPPQGIAATHR